MMPAACFQAQAWGPGLSPQCAAPGTSPRLGCTTQLTAQNDVKGLREARRRRIARVEEHAARPRVPFERERAQPLSVSASFQGADAQPKPVVERACVIALESAAHDGLKRSEEHTSELQSLMRIPYAVFCMKTKKK